MSELALYACDQCYRCKTRCGRQIPQCERCRGQSAVCTYSVAGPETTNISNSERVAESVTSGTSQRSIHSPRSIIDYSSDPTPDTYWTIGTDATSRPLPTAPAAVFSNEPSFPFNIEDPHLPGAIAAPQPAAEASSNGAQSDATHALYPIYDQHQQCILPSACGCVPFLLHIAKTITHTNPQAFRDGFTACETCLTCCAASDHAAVLACLFLMQKTLIFLQHYGAAQAWYARASMIIEGLEASFASHGRSQMGWMDTIAERLRREWREGREGIDGRGKTSRDR